VKNQPNKPPVERRIALVPALHLAGNVRGSEDATYGGVSERISVETTYNRHTDLLIGTHGGTIATVNFNPSHIGPSAGPFGAQMSASTPSGDAAPTERLTSVRQPRAQGMRIQPIDRSRNQFAGDQPARAQRTRRTVDLPPATHRALDIWQREAADRLGVARVTGQEVLTALIDQLLADPKLAAQITRAIQERR
jgi:hypothetical protein